MEIIFNAGDKVNVKGYRSEGTVNTTFTTETRDFGCDVVRVQMGNIEIIVASEDVAKVEVVKHVSRVVSSRPMTDAERRSFGYVSPYLSVGELCTSYGKTISLS